MEAENLTLVDATGAPVGELIVTSEEDGWFYGELHGHRFPAKLQEALDWYDEVVEHQMLSFLDEALASVDRFGIQARCPNGAIRKVFSLQVSKNNEVSFRTTPVPPPAWLSRSESA